jgi:DNA-binding transcriptional LysR family regulator
MELRHVRYFLAVAEELHFGRAALKLGISQPPLSQQIRALERELGVALFQRTKRRVRLTDPGRVFQEAARVALETVERAVAAAQQAGRGEVGRLVIGYVPWTDFTEFPRIIRMFGERHPDVQLELDTLGVPEQVAALRVGRIDVGFVRPPVLDPALSTEPVLSAPVVVIFPVGHRFARFRRVAVQELEEERCILLSRRQAPAFHDHVMALCRAAGLTLSVKQEVDRAETVVSFVAAGLGISLVPGSASGTLRPGVLQRRLDPPGPPLETLAAWRRDDASALVREFLGVLREVRDARRQRPGRGDGRA